MDRSEIISEMKVAYLSICADGTLDEVLGAALDAVRRCDAIAHEQKMKDAEARGEIARNPAPNAAAPRHADWRSGSITG